MFGGPPPPFERDFSGKANAKNGVDWSAINDNPEHIYDVIVPVIRDHRLFVTERGFMGIAPRTACIGDSVFVLKGGPLPFILRPGTPAEGDCSHPPEYCFELVGSCYVHGIMDGEA